MQQESLYIVLCPKQGPKIEGVVLHRVGILGVSVVLNRVSGNPIPKHGSIPTGTFWAFKKTFGGGLKVRDIMLESSDFFNFTS